MPQSILAQIESLRRMTVAELQAKHLELFGTETRSRHKDQLFKRLAWRIQELAYGGLSERAMRRAVEIANDLDARYRPPRNGDGPLQPPATPLTPGALLAREYHGEPHQVTVLDHHGFEYRGKVYRSLSGVARAITGTQWSGALFFGLRSRNGKRQG